MTPEEIAVQQAHPFGRVKDVPFREMIKDKLLYWTERMVRNTVDKDPKRRKQILGLFKPMIVKMHRANNFPTGHPGNYKTYAESSIVIPAPLYANSIDFDYVGSVDGTTAFIESSGPMIDRFGSSDKYLGNALRYSYIGGRFQVYRNDDIMQIRADYIPSNFKDYSIANATMCNTECTWDNDEYPLPGDILQLVMAEIAKELARPYAPENHDREEVRIDAGK